MGIMTTDPLADLLTRIRNASALGKRQVVLPHSKFKFNLAKILAEQGYITEVKASKGDKPAITITLGAEAKPIKGISKISKPGRRVYVKSHEIPVVRQGLGIAIVSTPQGLMLGHRAKARQLGGELLCKVW